MLLRPGNATPLASTVQINGAHTYKPKGSFLLLTVIENDHPSLAQYLRSKLFDSNVSVESVPPPSPVNTDLQDECDMTDSQATAKYVALKRLGYTIPTLPGVQVDTIQGSMPAAHVLQCGDVIDAVNGTPTRTPADLSKAIGAHRPGDHVTVTFHRGDRTHNEVVQLGCLPANAQSAFTPEAPECKVAKVPPIIGIDVSSRYRYPVDISIDTNGVTGPSGGLAMTLTLLDMLTPCNLTGGAPVAVTGEIFPDGTVGPIGGTPKKVVAARHAGAKLFIVAAGSDDLDQARAAAKGMHFVVVDSLDQALHALQQAGGDPLSCRNPTSHKSQ